jgi:uncharacterized protein (TIGR02266 family)
MENTGVTARETQRAVELLHAGVSVLREEIAEHGSFARAIDRLDRVSRKTDRAGLDDALDHALAIGRAVYETLEPRGKQCVETLAHAQLILQARPIPRVQGEEMRASPRARIDVAVSFESEDNFYQGFSEDIGDGGLFIATYDLKPIGSIIDIELTLPSGHIMRASAEVRWLRDLRDDCEGVSPGMGLAFRELLPEDRRAIGAFVDARAPIFYDD